MRACLAALLLLVALPVAAQDPAALPFRVELVERSFAAMPGLHSFAWAEHDGKWLFVAGRVDGLHGIVEFAFPADEANDAVWVVDRATEQVWSRSLDELGDAVADPLRATNPQYHQDGETLYVIGGYGTDSATGQMVTFPTLTALDVPGLIEAVTTGDALAPHLRQTTDERLAVTGGELRTFNGEYVLFGGQRFDGTYSAGGSGFTQAYTERIALFSIEDSEALVISDPLYLDYDPDVLHRRDMTVAPTYLRVGNLEGETFITEWLGLYGGVFRPDANLPYRTQIYFGATDIYEYFESGYEQQFAHYTCPALPLWDAATETMHTTFFGGMAQFVYDEETETVEQDYLVPFTDDIVTLTNDLDEDSPATYETVMPEPMPGLLGTNAVLVPAPGVPRSAHGVVQLGDLTARTLVGWIVGGIESSSANPGWMSMVATETNASSRLFEVWVTPQGLTASEPGAAPLAVALEAPYPNPFRTEATVAFVLDRDATVTVEVFDALGRRVARLHDGPLAARRHAFAFRPGDLPSGVYYARVHGDGVSETRPLVHVR
ncbi:MAG: T9SS type A sorting domain-containing protein [Rhodothermales bacterium]